MIQIPLTQGQFALIDDEDFDIVSKHKWHAKKYKHTYYAATNIKKEDKKTILRMHRLIINVPDGMEIDHLDHNGCNNQKYNIKVCTHWENMQNKKNQYDVLTTTKMKGVYFDNTTKKWKSTIWINGRSKSLKSSDRLEYAIRAYNRASMFYFGERAFLNYLE